MKILGKTGEWLYKILYKHLAFKLFKWEGKLYNCRMKITMTHFANETRKLVDTNRQSWTELEVSKHKTLKNIVDNFKKSWNIEVKGGTEQ